MRKTPIVISLLLSIFVLATLVDAARKKPGEPDRVVVQHVLISFKQRAMPKVTRSKAEAKQLAEEVLARAEGGEDFDALVQELTDDRHPGIYTLTNHGVTKKSGEFNRDDMVPAFGDVSFSLEVGAIGTTRYNARTSPYGWHIIKRIE